MLHLLAKKKSPKIICLVSLFVSKACLVTSSCQVVYSFSVLLEQTRAHLVNYVCLFPFLVQVMWVCNLCRKQQEILTKSGEWFSGSGGRPGSLANSLNNLATGGEAQRDRKLLRSRSQAPPNTNANAALPDGTQPTAAATAAKGAGDIMLGSRSQSEPPREK